MEKNTKHETETGIIEGFIVIRISKKIAVPFKGPYNKIVVLRGPCGPSGLLKNPIIHSPTKAQDFEPS